MKKSVHYNKFIVTIVMLIATLLETRILLSITNNVAMSYFVFALAVAIISGLISSGIIWMLKLKVNVWFDHRVRLFDAALFFGFMTFLNDSFLFPNYFESLSYVIGIEIVLHLFFWVVGKK